MNPSVSFSPTPHSATSTHPLPVVKAGNPPTVNAFIAGSHGTGSEDGLKGKEGDWSLDSIFQGKFILAAMGRESGK